MLSNNTLRHLIYHVEEKKVLKIFYVLSSAGLVLAGFINQEPHLVRICDTFCPLHEMLEFNGVIRIHIAFDLFF